MTLLYAFAKLKELPGNWLWVVPCCPVCQGRHVHGGGAITDDPRALLGHRIAHCPAEFTTRGYWLTDDPNLQGQEVIR